MSYPQMSEDVLSLFVRFITLKKAKLLMGYVPFGIKPWAKVKKHSSRKPIYHHPVTSPFKYKRQG